mgnify:CR=1 FL=1
MQAHRLKSAESVLYATLLGEYTVEYKVLLTGTPVQNRLEELWALLHFLHPTLFQDSHEFVARYAPLQQRGTASSSSSSAASVDAVAEELHGVMRPFVLRRVKEEGGREGQGENRRGGARGTCCNRAFTFSPAADPAQARGRPLHRPDRSAEEVMLRC